MKIWYFIEYYINNYLNYLSFNNVFQFPYTYYITKQIHF